MWHAHENMPLHHIEYWTGRFFRATCLWEVGNYILVPHYSPGGRLCNELIFQTETLEAYQREKDQAEQFRLLNVTSSTEAALDAAHEWGDSMNEEERDEEETSEECDIGELDENYDDDIWLSEGYLDQNVLHDAAKAAADFLSASQGASKGSKDTMLRDHSHDAACSMPNNVALSGTHENPPGRDSLHNAYVRVIHINGVHHLAMVTCTCLAADNIHANLLSCRLIPTTFTRYRTLFTAGVLDDYRISNLECKVSGYQYYNKLRQLTNLAAPGNVPSFYHELLRLSRLWRWIKKLKWSGFGHQKEDPTTPKYGELANFCLACPQPGINLPLNWKDDTNRYPSSTL
jgi:hypothetical protein